MGRTKGGKNREWSKDQKYEIIKYVIDGEKSINDLGREFGISNGMICNWLKRYNEDVYKRQTYICNNVYNMRIRRHNNRQVLL